MTISLEDFLAEHAGADTRRQNVAECILALGHAIIALSMLVARVPFEAALARLPANEVKNAGGDSQRGIDVEANDEFVDRLAMVRSVAALASEEMDRPVSLHPDGWLAVAFDPLDGSANMETNGTAGAIFSILPAKATPAESFAQPGTALIAGGFAVFGPAVTLVISLGEGTHIFALDRALGRFLLVERNVRIPSGRFEYAINASNYRHWDNAIRAFVDECIAGKEGPRQADFNMRWFASLVSEAYRILLRGGVYLYPADVRPGYGQGRLRLIYEAHPIALCIEQAGGEATDGVRRILDLANEDIHGRVPLVFGSATKVARVRAFCTGEVSLGDASPLFARRGLFRS